MAIGRREFIALLGSAAACPVAAQRLGRILYVTHAAGYRHEVLPLSQAVLQRLGERDRLFEVTPTEDMSEFTTDKLTRYDTVMFCTTGELPMSHAQKAALLDFVRAGRGFVGIHSATDTFYQWPDYLAL